MGMRPMELVALGVASCSSYDVMRVLRKARQTEPVPERITTTNSSNRL